MCPKNFTRVGKKCDLSGAAFMFTFNNIWLYFSNSLNISCFVCDCMKTLSKYVIIFLRRISGLKVFHINADKAAGFSHLPLARKITG